jgi:hypothetical protein
VRAQVAAQGALLEREGAEDGEADPDSTLAKLSGYASLLGRVMAATAFLRALFDDFCVFLASYVLTVAAERLLQPRGVA